ncbi:MAG: hypothetical protein FWD31_09955, partial [Planctomycetaceae bacterium]|nr:hypothetical protein [Planctomycetaceae bacterium]
MTFLVVFFDGFFAFLSVCFFVDFFTTFLVDFFAVFLAGFFPTFFVDFLTAFLVAFLFDFLAAFFLGAGCFSRDVASSTPKIPSRLAESSVSES